MERPVRLARVIEGLPVITALDNTRVPATVPPAKICHPDVTGISFPRSELRDRSHQNIARNPENQRYPNTGSPALDAGTDRICGLHVEIARGRYHILRNFSIARRRFPAPPSRLAAPDPAVPAVLALPPQWSWDAVGLRPAAALWRRLPSRPRGWPPHGASGRRHNQDPDRPSDSRPYMGHASHRL